MAYFNDAGETNHACVSPFSDPIYEGGIANVEDLIKQLEDTIAEIIETAKQVTSYVVQDLQVLPADGQIVINPSISLHIIPVISDGGPITTNDITFITSDLSEPREGTSVRIVGMSDVDTVTLKSVDMDDAIRSSGNILLRKFFIVEYFYLNKPNTTKGWIRSAKSP